MSLDSGTSKPRLYRSISWLYSETYGICSHRHRHADSHGNGSSQIDAYAGDCEKAKEVGALAKPPKLSSNRNRRRLHFSHHQRNKPIAGLFVSSE